MSEQTQQLDEIQRRVVALLNRGDVEGALSCYDEMLRRGPRKDVRAWCLCWKGDTLARFGGAKEAIAVLHEVLHISEQGSRDDDLRLVAAFAHYYLAMSLQGTTEGEQHASVALRPLEKFLRGAQEPEECHRVQEMLAQLYEMLGRDSEAVAAYESGLATAEEGGGRILALKALAWARGRVEGYEAGRRLFIEARTLAENVPSTLSNVLWDFGCFQWEEGEDYDGALESFRGALDHLGEDPILSKNPSFRAGLHWRLARLFYENDDFEGTLKHASESLAYCEQESAFAGGNHLLLGHCLAALGNHERARDHYLNALQSPNLGDGERNMAYEGLRSIGSQGMP